jgi:hypothetical protein
MDIAAVLIRVHKSNQSTMANRRRLYLFTNGNSTVGNSTICQQQQ